MDLVFESCVCMLCMDKGVVVGFPWGRYFGIFC